MKRFIRNTIIGVVLGVLLYVGMVAWGTKETIEYQNRVSYQQPVPAPSR